MMTSSHHCELLLGSPDFGPISGVVAAVSHGALLTPLASCCLLMEAQGASYSCGQSAVHSGAEDFLVWGLTEANRPKTGPRLQISQKQVCLLQCS